MVRGINFFLRVKGLLKRFFAGDWHDQLCIFLTSYKSLLWLQHGEEEIEREIRDSHRSKTVVVQ